MNAARADRIAATLAPHVDVTARARREANRLGRPVEVRVLGGVVTIPPDDLRSCLCGRPTTGPSCSECEAVA